MITASLLIIFRNFFCIEQLLCLVESNAATRFIKYLLPNPLESFSIFICSNNEFCEFFQVLQFLKSVVVLKMFFVYKIKLDSSMELRTMVIW